MRVAISISPPLTSGVKVVTSIRQGHPVTTFRRRIKTAKALAPAPKASPTVRANPARITA